jgi:hypothetical protein
MSVDSDSDAEAGRTGDVVPDGMKPSSLDVGQDALRLDVLAGAGFDPFLVAVALTYERFAGAFLVLADTWGRPDLVGVLV